MTPVFEAAPMCAHLSVKYRKQKVGIRSLLFGSSVENRFLPVFSFKL